MLIIADSELIALMYRKTGNQTLLPTIQTLHQADLLRNRQSDGMFQATRLLAQRTMKLGLLISEFRFILVLCVS
jgi:hypothetical protein